MSSDRPKPFALRQAAGLGDYLKHAFLYRWNMLLFLGGSAAAVLTPWPDAALPLVAAAEIAYLVGLVAHPRFRAAIDAKIHQAEKGATAAPSQAPATRSIGEIVTALPPEARRRFEALHGRCNEMRRIAQDVRGRTAGGSEAGEEIRTPALDRLLWVFLRLLASQDALARFLKSTSDQEIRARLDELRKNLAAAKGDPDERVARSLQDNVSVHELRLDNYLKAVKNAQFVAIELDRIEGKIQVLTEMSVNRQDPGFLSSQVDSVAESMRQTEKAISELQHITGLSDELEEPPAILDTDVRSVVRTRA